MFAGFAVGLRGPALFHLLTHAAFKALLFLGAGCVIHGAGTALMSRMGGLRRSMPVTFVAMTIGLGALAGVPPFSGFFSKDAIVEAAWDGVGNGSWVPLVVLITALATVVLTAWYATRLWLRTFFGDYRGASESRPHDPGPLMRWPVVVLAIPAALLGFAGLSSGFARSLAGPGSTRGAFTPWNVSTGVSLVLVAAGVVAAWSTWRRDPAADPARRLGAARPVFANAFYLDTVQHNVVVRPMVALASLVKRGDFTLVDGAVEGTAISTLRVGGWTATWHHGAVPRAAAAVLGGALLLGIAAVIVGGL
jgi:NADH-quinone oxidoreductase subunit L